MEINVGIYARVTNYENKTVIGKITELIDEQTYLLDTENEDTSGQYVIDKNDKHSKDIIDLIEVGDYVNGHKVDEVSVEQKALWLENRKYFNESINDKDIKSILTHEQFESNAYTIEKER